MADIDYARLLLDRPDVLAEYQQERGRDSKSINNLVAIGATSPEAYGQWWYNNYGRNEGYSQAPVAPSGPVAADPTASTNPTPNPVTGNPLDPMPGDNNTNQAIVDLIKSIGSMLGGFNQQNSKQQQLEEQRNAARESVYGLFGSSGSKIGSNMLDQTITDLLGGKYQSALTQLERGKERGQYNDVGYAAGMSALDRNRDAIKGRLQQQAEGILGGYRTQYDQLRDQALNQASTSSGSFSIDPFKGQIDDLLGRIGTQAPGAFLDTIGNDPLFDLNSIRGDIGSAQGALNLRDISLVDALAKRKKADSLGRGLGSQGSF